MRGLIPAFFVLLLLALIARQQQGTHATHDGSGELERATLAGCDWFVPKPCPPQALVIEIRRVLNASE